MTLSYIPFNLKIVPIMEYEDPAVLKLHLFLSHEFEALSPVAKKFFHLLLFCLSSLRKLSISCGLAA